MADATPNMRDSPTGAGRAAGWMLALPLLGLTVYFIRFLPMVASGEAIRIHWEWAPSLGVNLSFMLDGLSLLFVLLITGIGALVMVYAGGYMAGHPYTARFFALLLLFTASMLGLVLAENLLLVYVFWELTSLSSYFLIGFEHERSTARAAALQALLATVAGGLSLLGGVILLGQAGGSFQVSTLLSQAPALRGHPYYVPALILILVGAFTKSAQFPFHFWLPSAMEAPTPVSAYLHSATMVKAGVYLLARLSSTLGGTEIWFAGVSGVGVITMLVGGWLALAQSDLKRILAYSTISALGMLMLLLGIGGPLAVQAAMAYLLGHALYKGALFFVAGTLDHETGTRHIDQLGGLFRKMPITALAAGVAALSMAGLPPLFGFIAKELTYEATLHASAMWLVTAGAVVANLLLVAAAGLVGLRPFLGAPRTTPRPAHEAPPSMLIGPLVLAGLSIAFGLSPQWCADGLISAASRSILGQPTTTHLAIWHGFTPALALSALTLVAGVGAYAARNHAVQMPSRWHCLKHWGPAGWYQLALAGLNRLAAGQTRLLQSGYLRYYLMITVTTTVAVVAYVLIARGTFAITLDWTDIRIYEAGLSMLIVLAVLSAVLTKARLAAIAALGVVGYGVALVFVLFGAPDLAMTQFLVETLTVILFVLVFYHLPEPRTISDKAARWRDAVLAVSAGAVMTALVLVGTPKNYEPISEYFEKHSVTQGHGRNVVNVILVDFRALDTLGEITVLTVAAVGVYGLLKLKQRPNTGDRITASEPYVPAASDLVNKEPVAANPPREENYAKSLILRTTTRLLLPLLLLFSIFLLVRGHNEPGGGFSAALIAASAFILYRFAFGAQAARRAFPVSPLALSGAGLIVAIVSGSLALFEGQPLLTGIWKQMTAPGFGELHIGTPLLFDTGVYMTVLGVALSIILPLAEE